MRSLVCLGDSFTEGVHDDVRPDGRFIGWSDRVARGLAIDATPDTVEYANLAVRGKLLDQIVELQIPSALALNPDILTIHAGANDVLRPSTDIDALIERYDRAIATVAEPTRTIVMFTSIGRAGGTGRLANTLAERFGRYNAGIREISERHDTLLVDLEHIPVLSDRRMWHEDRLHLNADGHRRVAAATLAVLGVEDPRVLDGAPGWWGQPLPRDSQGTLRKAGSDATWIVRHLAPWVVRRLRGVSSGDSVVAKDASMTVVEIR
jgi:lysophospholipase L1-like esterase